MTVEKIKIKIMPKTIEKKHSEKQQWFIDRIGKKVYRHKLKCQCNSCQNEDGTLVLDHDHACYLTRVSSEMGIKYYDKICGKQ